MGGANAEKLKAVCHRHGIGLVYLFGSQAHLGLAVLAGKRPAAGDPLSDLDVGVVTNGPLPAPDERAGFYAGLYNDLEEIFRPLRLDLSLLEENHAIFQYEAIKGFCVFCADPKKKDEYEMMVLRRAADFRPFLAKYLEEVLEEV